MLKIEKKRENKLNNVYFMFILFQVEFPISCLNF